MVPPLRLMIGRLARLSLFGCLVVARDVAIQRISAAVEARRQGADLVIVARTDARSAFAQS